MIAPTVERDVILHSLKLTSNVSSTYVVYLHCFRNDVSTAIIEGQGLTDVNENLLLGNIL
jgi:hypothetical protein